jgi:hypothetical protein
VEAVLIHKHHARISPRLIPGSSPRSALHWFGLRRGPTWYAGPDAVRNAVVQAKYRCHLPSHPATIGAFNESGNVAETDEAMIGGSVTIGFLAELLERGIGAQWVPDWIEPKKGRRDGCWAIKPATIRCL